MERLFKLVQALPQAQKEQFLEDLLQDLSGTQAFSAQEDQQHVDEALEEYKATGGKTFAKDHVLSKLRSLYK